MIVISVLITVCLTSGYVLGDKPPLSFSATMKDFSSDGVTLDIVCNYSVSEDTVPPGGVVSLTISRTDWHNTTYTDVASINTFNREEVLFHEDVNAEAVGAIGSTGRSAYLKLSYHSLLRSKLGGFRCESTCLTDTGKCIHSQETVVISPGTLGVPEVNTLLKELQMCQASVNASRVKRSDIIALTGATVHWVRAHPTSGHIYALANKHQVCTAIGGYVVEINTKEEYDFLYSTIKTPGYTMPEGKCCFATGAYLPDLSMPFTFRKHPEADVYMGSWANDEPDRDDEKRNALVVRLETDKMVMLDGLYSSHDTEYLCEIDVMNSGL